MKKFLVVTVLVATILLSSVTAFAGGGPKETESFIYNSFIEETKTTETIVINDDIEICLSNTTVSVTKYGANISKFEITKDPIVIFTIETEELQSYEELETKIETEWFEFEILRIAPQTTIVVFDYSQYIAN